MTLLYDDLIMSPDMEIDTELIEYWQKWIEQASHFEMCVMERYAPGGHVAFKSNIGLGILFERKFYELGGMTTLIYKSIGFLPITDTKFNTITNNQFQEIMQNA